MVKMSAQTAAVLKSKGSFVELELLDSKAGANDLRLYHYRVVFSKEELELFISLTKDNKIDTLKVGSNDSIPLM